VTSDSACAICRLVSGTVKRDTGEIAKAYGSTAKRAVKSGITMHGPRIRAGFSRPMEGGREFGGDGLPAQATPPNSHDKRSQRPPFVVVWKLHLTLLKILLSASVVRVTLDHFFLSVVI